MTIAATTAAATSTNTASSVSSTVNSGDIASNFTQFLQLLTTQLQNQDPLSPMNINQFTQQLVMFDQVEQQLKSNASLSTLVSLQQSAQATSAPQLVGATVVVNGANLEMSNSSAAWTVNASKPATATISITDSTGQAVYSGKYAVSSGANTFT